MAENTLKEITSNYIENQKLIEQGSRIPVFQKIEIFFTEGFDEFKFKNMKSFNNIIETYQEKPKEIVGRVPEEFLRNNNEQSFRRKIELRENNNIHVGLDWSKGIVMPRDFGFITFDELYNCSPLISLVKGEQDYISYLHIFSHKHSYIVDRQVKHWMQTLSEFGDVAETIFAPKKNGKGINTSYNLAKEHLIKYSKKTTIVNRKNIHIKGIATSEGTYIGNVGYHIWNQ